MSRLGIGLLQPGTWLLHDVSCASSRCRLLACFGVNKAHAAGVRADLSRDSF